MIICAFCQATDINKMSACMRVGEWRRDGGGDCVQDGTNEARDRCREW